MTERKSGLVVVVVTGELQHLGEWTWGGREGEKKTELHHQQLVAIDGANPERNIDLV